MYCVWTVIGGGFFYVPSLLVLAQALVVVSALAVLAAWLRVRSALRHDREMLRRFDDAPSAKVLFRNPRDITPDTHIPDVLVVRGNAVLVIDDSLGRAVEPVESAEFKMPVTAFTAVDDLAVAELLAFGADSIEGEFRHGRLLGVAVRVRGWQE